MDSCADAIARFCRDQGVVLPYAPGTLLRLDLADIGVLQFERLGGQLTLWLGFTVQGALFEHAMSSALRQVHDQQTSGLQLRCGLLPDERLVLLASLDERRVSEPVLHEAYRLLSRVRAEVLAA
ncbi:type III secretion chaperone SycN [Pseudomonas sp. BW16M2]|uniref:type III secretion chaperone SycN n=1 Tax=Pseudomonas sp. BW16M2 TaxID=2745489 RepID=UPI001645976E|nr:type III secretion chaperone SycN [Pseudomonas sp. BW16M2]MBC3437489.1 type III secretion chaperone SycN [Pseudomonas sp. BW16M2]